MNVEFGGEQHESAIAKVLKATKSLLEVKVMRFRWFPHLWLMGRLMRLSLHYLDL